jgi:hypothetical protein
MPDAKKSDGPIQEIAAFGLTGRDEERIEISESEWSVLKSRLAPGRLTGLALAAASSGALELSEADRKELFESHHSAMMWALGLERELVSLVPALEVAGVEAIVLKGSAFAHSIYPDPSWRPFGDLDLIVRTRHWRRACSLLRDLGWIRRLPEPRTGFDERFGKAAVHRNQIGMELDLHRTLVLGPFGLWMSPEDLFEQTVEFSLGGANLLRLNDSAQLLHACAHAALGVSSPMLIALRDVAQIVRRPGIDWMAIRQWTERWRLGAVLAYAFERVAEAFHIDLPKEAQAFMRGTYRRAELNALAAYTTPNLRSRGSTAISTIRAIHGLRNKAAYVTGLLIPEEEFLRARQGNGASYLRRWKVPVRWFVRKKGRP